MLPSVPFYLLHLCPSFYLKFIPFQLTYFRKCRSFGFGISRKGRVVIVLKPCWGTDNCLLEVILLGIPFSLTALPPRLLRVDVALSPFHFLFSPTPSSQKRSERLAASVPLVGHLPHHPLWFPPVTKGRLATRSQEVCT